MSHPISCVVTSADHASERDFASAALPLLTGQSRVLGEISEGGLIVRGVTELDIEIAVHEIRQHFFRVSCGKPTVDYRYGSPILEPYYRATVDIPEECLGSVMADMSRRRGTIQGILDVPLGKRFVATVPVSDCFGYYTILRMLTKGKGTYSLEFSHYGEAGGTDAA